MVGLNYEASLLLDWEDSRGTLQASVLGAFKAVSALFVPPLRCCFNQSGNRPVRDSPDPHLYAPYLETWMGFDGRRMGSEGSSGD